METLQSTIFIEFDVNTKKITFLRGDNIVDYDSNITSVYVRVKYKNLSGNTVYLTPSELESYKFSLYTIKPATNNVNVIAGEVTDELKENVYGGVIKFEIPRACTNRLGIVKCEIHINQGNKIIGSSTFVLDVKQSLVTAFDDELLGDEDFPVLKQLILEIQKASNIDDSNRSKITSYSSDKIETIREDLSSQIKEKANKNDLDIEKARIDLLTKIENGETSGNTELLDIRIGINGKTYDTAGNHVRDISIECNDLYSKLGIIKTINLSFIVGGLNDNGTLNPYLNYTIISDVFFINNPKFIIKNKDKTKDFGFTLCKYSSKDDIASFTKYGDYFHQDAEFDNDSACYRLMITKGQPLTEDDIPSLVDNFIIEDGITSRYENIISEVESITAEVESITAEVESITAEVESITADIKSFQAIYGTKLNMVIGNLHANGAINTNASYDAISEPFKINTSTFTITNKGEGSFALAKFYDLNDLSNHEIMGYYSQESFTFDNDAAFYRILVGLGRELTSSDLPTIMNNIIVKSNEYTDYRKLQLPNKIFINSDGNLRIPYASMLNCRNKNYYIRHSGWWWYHLFNDHFLYKGLSGNGYADFELYDDLTGKKIDEKRLNFQVVDPSSISNPSTTKTLMVLGDSFIQAGVIINEIKSALDEHNLTNIKMVGTSTSNGTGTSVPREGNGGYRAWDFINDPANLRDEFPTNPFWNSSTGKVDFKYYVENVINETSLDYVIIHLGINDKLTDNLQDTNGNIEIVNRIKTLVNYIHADYPNCKVFVDGLVIISKFTEFYQYEQYRDDIFEYNNMLESELSNMNNTFYVPVLTTFNDDYAYEYVYKNDYAYSDETYKVVTEWLHPNKAGYKMIADQIIACFLCNL